MKHLILLLLPGLLFSQQIIVSGSVKTKQNENIPYASVLFKNKQQENSTDQGVLTDEAGKFNIELKKGHYTMEIIVVGFQTSSYTLDLTKAKKKYNAGIYSIDTTLNLEEVVVSGEENAIQILPGEKVYNVAKDPAAQGVSLTGVMENLPSVQVNNDQIAIRGDQNVTLLVDGQPNGLTENLSTFPSSMVERIEVITSPGAKYQARGSAGIINIILKKGNKYEYNSSSELFSSYPLAIGVNGNISQVGKKGNGYVNLSTGLSQPIGRNIISLETPLKEIIRTEQETERKRKQKYILVNTGKSYDLNENIQINGSVSIRKAISDNLNTVEYKDELFDNSKQNSKRIENEDGIADMYQGSLSYTQNFGNKASLKAQINGELSNKNKKSIINTENHFVQQQSTPSNSTEKEETKKNYSVTLDYSNEINEKTSIDFGYRYDNIHLGSDFKVNQIFGNSIEEISDFTNLVGYNESLHAGYVEMKINLEKESWTLGLRGENTGIEVTANKGGFEQKKNYFNVFPSLRYLRELSKKTRLQVALYNRIQRPPRSTCWVLPYSTFTDNRNLFVGNPDIDPSYITGIEAELMMRPSKKISFYPALYYRLTKDELELYIEKRDITIGNETQEIYTSSLVNIGDYHAFGLELSYNYKPSKKFRVRGDLLFNGFHQVGSYNGVSFSGDGMIFSGKLIATYYFSETLDFQIRNYYDGPGRAGQYDMKGRFRMNMDIRKEIFKGKGRILLGMRDVFNSNYRRVRTEGEGFSRFLQLQTRIPQVNLSITYRFNQKRYVGQKGNQYDETEIIN